MTDKLHPKISELNRLFSEIRKYKVEHPQECLGYYRNNIGSILNAYREGDIGFEEAIKAVNDAKEIEQAAPPPDVSLRDAIHQKMTAYNHSIFPLVARTADKDIDKLADIAAKVVARRQTGSAARLKSLWSQIKDAKAIPFELVQELGARIEALDVPASAREDTARLDHLQKLGAYTARWTILRDEGGWIRLQESDPEYEAPRSVREAIDLWMEKVK